MGEKRVIGVDIARGLALIGMFIAHAAPYPDPSAEWIVDGRSSLLFATLAGVSLGLMSGGLSPTPHRGRMRLSASLRALLLIVLGLVLWALPTDIAIILDYYGLMFLLLVPLLFANRVVLAIVAAALLIVAPLVAAATEGWADRLAVQADSLGDVAFWFVVDRLLTGYYPALVWLPLLIVGLMAARSDLRSTRTQLVVLCGGVAGMVAGYGAAAVLPGADASAHSGTPAELLGSGGFAFAVMGLLLLATGPAAGAASRILRAVLSPIGAMGAMPLTIYTGHLVAIAIVTVASGVDDVDYDSWLFVVLLIIGSAVFALLWRRFVGRGPLEWVIRRLTR